MIIAAKKKKQIGLLRTLVVLCLPAFFLANYDSGPAFAAMPRSSDTVERPNADGRAEPTLLRWAGAANGTRPTDLQTGQNVGQVVPPEPGVSTKPLRDVKMPEWMTRLPPWMAHRTPKVGSRAWKREQAETERQEKEIRQAIDGVCRGC